MLNVRPKRAAFVDKHDCDICWKCLSEGDSHVAKVVEPVIHFSKNKELDGVSNHTTSNVRELGSSSTNYEDEMKEDLHAKTEEDINIEDDLEEGGIEENNQVKK